MSPKVRKPVDTIGRAMQEDRISPPLDLLQEISADGGFEPLFREAGRGSKVSQKDSFPLAGDSMIEADVTAYGRISIQRLPGHPGVQSLVQWVPAAGASVEDAIHHASSSSRVVKTIRAELALPKL
jgi:hypothetical protein